ncbi:uncharacterized protein LOC143353857 [Halictus rubicundus]|uniref:uncharacterized protein LOC143353857 n=1 Tax=Halictus rubicundus TaxID=77578 RepID=UPI004036575D
MCSSMTRGYLDEGTMSPVEDNLLTRRLMSLVDVHHEEEEHHHEDEDMSSVLIAKGVTMVILCVVSTCMGILPMQLAKCLKWNTTGVTNPRSTRLVSLLLGFGGGVLFCTTFLHLLPEVKEGVEDLTNRGELPELSFSLAEVLTCAGFFIMYLVEESVHSHLRHKQTKRENSKKDVSRSTNELVENGQTQPNCVSGHSHFSGHGHSHHLPIIMDEKDDFVISSLRGLLIVLGLSVHELFEGLAIGLESSATYVWYMFAAVAAHKFVIAFCIGVELIASNTRRYLSIIYVCTFAVVSPLGIGIGMGLVGGGSAAASGILPVLLQGLASGTLLYVVFFEILQEHRTGMLQYLSIIVGYLVMFGLQILNFGSVGPLSSFKDELIFLATVADDFPVSYALQIGTNSSRDLKRIETVGKIFRGGEEAIEKVIAEGVDKFIVRVFKSRKSNKMEETTTSTILLVAKVGAMIGLGFGSLILGMLPLIVGRYRMNHRQKRHRGISSNSSTCTSTSASNAFGSSNATTSANSQGLHTSLLLCFGGGVLLFTTFLHLAPEVRSSVERHQSNDQLPTLGTLSLSELLFCGGFFLVYFVEEAVHAALTGKPESSEALLYRTVSVRRCNNNQPGASSGTYTGSTTTVSTTTRSTWKEDIEDSEDNDSTKRSTHHLDNLDGKQDKTLPAIFVLSSPTGLSSSERHHPDHARHSSSVADLNNYSRTKHHEHKHVMTKNTSVQGLLTVLALSFHAIFEGLAVGLEPSIASVVYLAAAIATHKLVISFCVGMELYVAGASTRTTLGYLTIFSMVTPIGIAVGLALGHFKNDSENLGPTPTILQGMAAGTLLYVVFFEVLARERANEKSGLLQLMAIIVGFMLMLGLQIATAHSHSHSHSHSHGPPHDHEDEHHHEDDHDHEGDSHDHLVNSGKILTGTIDRVTETVTEAVSNYLSSSAQIPAGVRQRNGTITLADSS